MHFNWVQVKTQCVSGFQSSSWVFSVGHCLLRGSIPRPHVGTAGAGGGASSCCQVISWHLVAPQRLEAESMGHTATPRVLASD